jgi:hypothetical protein
VKWFNGRTYDYTTLLGDTDCCGGSECRPAFLFKQSYIGWKLRIPKDGTDPNSTPVIVDVAEGNITYRDLGGDGVAHACGYFDKDGFWKPYCTFIPRNSSAFVKPKLNRASFRQ